MTTILDYGINNLSSVSKAIRFLGFDCRISDRVGDAERLIIPGVGAFGAAMQQLNPLRDEIRAFADSGKPLMGICLGMQLLFDSSEEHGSFSGLGIVPGDVRYLPRDRGLKVPHMGWTTVQFQNRDGLGAGFAPGGQAYFVHSLHCVPSDRADIAATAEYGIEFCAALQHGNVWATQFHPEKSSDVGLAMLKNFLEFNP